MICAIVTQKLRYGHGTPWDAKETKHFGYVVVFHRHVAICQKYRFFLHGKILLIGRALQNPRAHVVGFLKTTNDLMARDLATILAATDRMRHRRCQSLGVRQSLL